MIESKLLKKLLWSVNWKPKKLTRNSYNLSDAWHVYDIDQTGTTMLKYNVNVKRICEYRTSFAIAMDYVMRNETIEIMDIYSR